MVLLKDYDELQEECGDVMALDFVRVKTVRKMLIPTCEVQGRCAGIPPFSPPREWPTVSLRPFALKDECTFG